MAEAARQGTKMEFDYGPEIQVLRGKEAIRERPGMYVGNTDDGTGLHQMVYYVVESAANEALVGKGRLPEVVVTLNRDGSCTVRDNGRGLPTEIVSGEAMSAAEAILTGQNGGNYRMFFGMHAFGVFVVNALSSWVKLRIWRNGKEHSMEFRDGETVSPLTVTGDAVGRCGTEVVFQPSPETFTRTEFDFARLQHGLRALATRNSCISIVLSDRRGSTETREEIRYHG